MVHSWTHDVQRDIRVADSDAYARADNQHATAT
jgi:hypothetical protein